MFKHFVVHIFWIGRQWFLNTPWVVPFSQNASECLSPPGFSSFFFGSRRFPTKHSFARITGKGFLTQKIHRAFKIYPINILTPPNLPWFWSGPKHGTLRFAADPSGNLDMPQMVQNWCLQKELHGFCAKKTFWRKHIFVGIETKCWWKMSRSTCVFDMCICLDIDTAMNIDIYIYIDNHMGIYIYLTSIHPWKTSFLLWVTTQNLGGKPRFRSLEMIAGWSYRCALYWCVHAGVEANGLVGLQRHQTAERTTKGCNLNLN